MCLHTFHNAEQNEVRQWLGLNPDLFRDELNPDLAKSGLIS